MSKHSLTTVLREAAARPGASTVRQSLDTQLDALKAADVTRVFAEKISTRATTRPELDKAVTLARELRAAGVAVTLVVHEHKRLGLDLAALAEQLRAAGIGLEFLTGEQEPQPARHRRPARHHQRREKGPSPLGRAAADRVDRIL
ncbi:recombinase family protein [Nonomuraea sp. 10N515B]|uniref:recombinase family protein n=1 Tax=Nonomuraea sp. 10N515B TaxID=3457422 RepID=UPI003FCD4DDB